MNKALCWLQIVVSAVLAAFLVGFVVYAIRRWTLGQYAGRPLVPLLGIPFLCVLAVLAVFSIRSSWRELSFSVTLSNEAIRLGDVVVPWESVTRVFGFYSLQQAFILRTVEGRRFLVPRVEQADLLEDWIRAKVIDGTVANVCAPGTNLARYDVSRKTRMEFQIVSVLCWCGCIAGFATSFVRHARSAVWLTAVYGSVGLLFFACWAWSRAHFSVAVFENAVRVGDSIARLDQISSVESSRMFGVVFFLRKRDGKKLRVFSGLENVSGLEETIRDR